MRRPGISGKRPLLPSATGSGASSASPAEGLLIALGCREWPQHAMNSGGTRHAGILREVEARQGLSLLIPRRSSCAARVW